MKKLVLLFACLALAACGAEDSYSEVDESQADTGDAGSGFSDDSLTSGGFDDEEQREPFDEDAARDRAEEEVADEGYDYRYGCTIDCSGHDAGFAYAADGNPDGGTSRSPSFDEGQVAYEEAVEERVYEYRQAYEDGEEQ